MNVPSDNSKSQIAALMDRRKRCCPGRARWSQRTKRVAGSSVLGRASASFWRVLRYWLWPLWRSTSRILVKERGLDFGPKASVYPMVRGGTWDILEH